MTFNTSVVQLPVSHINLQEKRFQITSDPDISYLADSIKKIGLISSPLIYLEDIDGKHSFTIISGFRRIKACKTLDMKTLKIRILEKDTKEFDLVRIAIAENAFQRPLNLMEKSKAYKMLSGFFPDENILAKHASCAGLFDSPQMIKKIRVLSHLPESVQKGILKDSISLAVALELDSFNMEDADLLAQLFTKLKLSTGKQREVLNLVKDICLCNEISLNQVLNEKSLCEILQDQDMDRNLKAFHLRKILKQRRYPSIVEAEKRYEENVKELKLGQNIKLVPPKNFEGTNYSLILNFSDIAQLKDQNKIIQRIIQAPALEKILE